MRADTRGGGGRRKRKIDFEMIRAWLIVGAAPGKRGIFLADGFRRAETRRQEPENRSRDLKQDRLYTPPLNIPCCC